MEGQEQSNSIKALDTIASSSLRHAKKRPLCVFLSLPHSDNHNHIILSSIESMVEAARKADVNIFSVTEHISQFTFMREKVKFTSIHETGRMFHSFKEYKEEFSKKVILVSPLKVRMGLEVDYLEGSKSILGKEISKEKWDLLLCSVHELSNGLDIEEKQQKSDFIRKDGQQQRSSLRWNEYFEIQEKALQSNFIPFDVLTHPTRLAVSTPIYPKDIEEKMNNLAEVALKNKRALELNGTDLLRMPELVRIIAKACGATGCKVSFGSDAHKPEKVSIAFSEASKLVREFGLKVRE